MSGRVGFGSDQELTPLNLVVKNNTLYIKGRKFENPHEKYLWTIIKFKSLTLILPIKKKLLLYWDVLRYLLLSADGYGAFIIICIIL
jgi:hypothetical protein